MIKLSHLFQLLVAANLMLQVGPVVAAQEALIQSPILQTADKFYQAYEQKSHTASDSQQAFQNLKQAAEHWKC